jgi:hypothetical protein
MHCAYQCIRQSGRNGNWNATVHGRRSHPWDELIGKANEKASVIRDRMSGGWVAIIEALRNALEG